MQAAARRTWSELRRQAKAIGGTDGGSRTLEPMGGATKRFSIIPPAGGLELREAERLIFEEGRASWV